MHQKRLRWGGIPHEAHLSKHHALVSQENRRLPEGFLAAVLRDQNAKDTKELEKAGKLDVKLVGHQFLDSRGTGSPAPLQARHRGPWPISMSFEPLKIADRNAIFEEKKLLETPLPHVDRAHSALKEQVGGSKSP